MRCRTNWIRSILRFAIMIVLFLSDNLSSTVLRDESEFCWRKKIFHLRCHPRKPYERSKASSQFVLVSGEGTVGAVLIKSPNFHTCRSKVLISFHRKWLSILKKSPISPIPLIYFRFSLASIMTECVYNVCPKYFFYEDGRLVIFVTLDRIAENDVSDGLCSEIPWCITTQFKVLQD